MPNKIVSQSDKSMDEKTGIDARAADSSSPARESHCHEKEIKSRSSDSLGDQKLDESIERMLSTYMKAKDDYHALGNASRTEKLDAVKFLRDTAENTLNYLRAHGLADHQLVPELQRSFEMAKDTATVLSGGRKRRFEILDEDRGRFSRGGFRRGPKYPKLRLGDYYRP